MSIKNILAVVAHPDDLELMAGGTMMKFLAEGKHIHVLVLTKGTWKNPAGIIVRTEQDIKAEVDNVTSFMNYTSYEILQEETMNLQYKDELVCEVLERISKYDIDTIITLWNKDTHRDHRIANEIALAASRRVPNFLMGQVNFYMTDVFTPNFYVDISSYWKEKIKCMSCFTSQWERNKQIWTDFFEATAIYYGKIIGVDKAEGFIIGKMAY